MSSPSDFYGPNIGYVMELYEKFQEAPDAVDPATADFFRQWSPTTALAAMNGGTVAPSAKAATEQVDMHKVVAAVELAQAVRQFGHLAAQLDPLGNPPPGDPALDPETHGISAQDLRQLPPGLIVSGEIAHRTDNAYEAINILRDIYSRSIGYDNEHIQNLEEREWLKRVAEAREFAYEATSKNDQVLLTRLTQIEMLEQFLQRTFPTKYRFSIEGLDMMVPMLDEMVAYAAHTTDTRLLTLGMAHRGRLNVLAHIMNRDYRKILAEFADTARRAEENEAVGWTVDDVKYHKGAVHYIEDGDLELVMSPNPSHLELVAPVVVGMARAAASDTSERGEPRYNAHATMQILIHGDAAFPGQGIVAETFNLSRLPGYAVGGTVHIIANNQLGFTTLPVDGRSTLYASDLAKGYRVPIVHVNADDPAACIEVARMAAAYTAKFEKDFLIDLVGYRRYGHNELDEPGFTQPLFYDIVRDHQRVRELWAQTLAERGSVSAAFAEELEKTYYAQLQDLHDAMSTNQSGIADLDYEKPEKGAAKQINTTVSRDDLIAINDGLTATLEGFNFYSKRFEKTIRKRRTVFNEPDERVIDWAGAEEFAFASILADGIPIRMTGQDSQRGTFSHRHAVLHDAKSGVDLAPLQRLPQAHASFEIRNSPLSEEAVLGFEYGYDVFARHTLVIWEAQYGDFVNGAQNVIDEFIASAREKWGDLPALVMLLPHGHEGAGPDHSSGRVERFLSLSAKINMRIANPTTAAQYFHLLRRQALLLENDPLPLVVMTPKSLLRNPIVAANMHDFTDGRWQPVIDDAWVNADDVTRLVFVSGKFYYDLAGAKFREQYPNVALVRVEQLYPYPLDELQAITARYPNVTQVVWAQEEPKNMGAWDFMNYRLKKMIGMSIPVNYVGRRRSSSPAEGSKTAWAINQAMITEYAFDWDFEKDDAYPRHKADKQPS